MKDDKVRWCRQHFLNSRSLKKAVDIYKQLADYLRGMALTVPDLADSDDLLGPDNEGEALRRALTSGLFMHAAMRQPDGKLLQDRLACMQSLLMIFKPPSTP